MGWIIGVVLAVLVAIGLHVIGTLLSREKDASDAEAVGHVLKWSSIVVFVLWVGIETSLAMAQQVPAGMVRVVYEFGAIKGQIGEGFHLIAPWRSTVEADIRVQRHFFEKLDAFSAETQDVFVAATLNIRVSPEAIQGLYRTVGPDFFDILVAPRVAQNFKDETVKYKSVDIAPNRETIRVAVRDRLEKELAPSSIEVVDLLLENIDFRPEFKEAIEQKQIATQNALEAEQRVKQAEFQAQSTVKTAEGSGQAILVVAQKQAEANAALSASLTPELIQYSLIQKLGDQIKVIMLPGDQPFILGQEVLSP